MFDAGAVNEVDRNERKFFLEPGVLGRFLVEERKNERFKSDGGKKNRVEIE